MAKGDGRRREEERAEEEVVDTKAEKDETAKEEESGESGGVESEGVSKPDEPDYDAGVDDAIDEAEAPVDPVEDPSKPVSVRDGEAPGEEDEVDIESSFAGESAQEDNSAAGSTEETEVDNSIDLNIGDGSEHHEDYEGHHDQVVETSNATPEAPAAAVPVPEGVQPVGGGVIDANGPGQAGNGPAGDDTPDPPEGPGNVYVPGAFGDGDTAPEVDSGGGDSGAGPIDMPVASFGAGAGASSPPPEAAPAVAEVEDMTALAEEPQAPILVEEEPIVEEAPAVVDLVEEAEMGPVDEAADLVLPMD